MDRVVVVGAGVTGLTVANALTHAGVECVVLEARDRVGGRLHNVELAGVPVALEPGRRAAIDRLGFGRYEKVVLRFDTAFWRDAELSHLMLYPADPDLPATWVFDHDAFDGQPVLTVHAFPSVTGRVLDGSPDEAVSWALGLLAGTGLDCPAPVDVAVTGWALDPCTRGAYTHVPPGSDPADADLLGEPVAGRVLFAGEHTQSARLGYADGALTSGIREAKRLLRRPAVELGRLDVTASRTG